MALDAAGQKTAVRAEIYETVTEIYRADQQLPSSSRDRERAPERFPAARPPRLALRETGDSAKALRPTRGARGQPRGTRSSPQVIPRPAVAGRARQGDRRVERDPRGPRTTRSSSSSSCDALMQRAGPRARDEAALTELEAAGPDRRRGAVPPRRFLRRIGETDRSLKV